MYHHLPTLHTFNIEDNQISHILVTESEFKYISNAVMCVVTEVLSETVWRYGIMLMSC